MDIQHIYSIGTLAIKDNENVFHTYLFEITKSDYNQIDYTLESIRWVSFLQISKRRIKTIFKILLTKMNPLGTSGYELFNLYKHNNILNVHSSIHKNILNDFYNNNKHIFETAIEDILISFSIDKTLTSKEEFVKNISKIIFEKKLNNIIDICNETSLLHPQFTISVTSTKNHITHFCSIKN